MPWHPVVVGLAMVVIVAAAMTVLLVAFRSDLLLDAGTSDDHRGQATHIVRRKYLELATVVTATSVVAVLTLGSWPLASILVPPFLCLFGFMGSVSWVRHNARSSTRDTDGLSPQEQTAHASTTTVQRSPHPEGWFIASGTLVVTTFAAGLLQYSRLPNSIPTHWSLNGVADQFAPKSFTTVFLPLFTTLGLLLFLAAIAWMIRKGNPGRRGLVPQPGHAQTPLQTRATVEIVGALALAVSAMLTGSSVSGWFLPDTGLPNLIRVAGIALIAVALIIGMWTYLQTAQRAGDRISVQSRTPTADETGRPAQVAGDDQAWKSTVIYFNRKNRALLVPKHIGFGWTINMGHPASWLIVAAFVAVVIAALTLPPVLG